MFNNGKQVLELIHSNVHTRCDQKFLARYASVRFIELKSLSVGHLILLKDIGSLKSWLMLGCLCKALLREEGVTHLQNGET